MVSERLVREKVKSWQEFLRLMDWDINVVFLEPTEIKKQMKRESVAFIKYWLAPKTATIFLPTKLETSSICGFPPYDFLIVHEMVHLILSDVAKWTDDFWYISQSLVKGKARGLVDEKITETVEVAVNRLAKIILRLFLMWAREKQKNVETELTS